MDTDRHAPDGDERRDASSSSPAPDAQNPEALNGEPEAPPHEYGYGETPVGPAHSPADGPGPDAASGPDAATTSGTESTPASASTPGAVPIGDAAPGTDPTGLDPSTGLHPATGVRGTTAPRAVLRPVPEGFPTPPPRPAVPNRRPARKPDSDPEASPARPRRLLIAGIAVAAALLLIVVIGGGILALRALAPEGSAPRAGTSPSAAPMTSEPAQAATDDVVLTEVSTEVGVRAVGSPGARVEPEGEFVVVVFEVENPSTTNLLIDQTAILEAGGGAYSLDPDATSVLETDTSHYGVVRPGEAVQFHAVFDVPIGADPTAIVLEIPGIDETLTLPLDG